MMLFCLFIHLKHFTFDSGFRVLTMGLYMPRDLYSFAASQLPVMEGHAVLCSV